MAESCQTVPVRTDYDTTTSFSLFTTDSLSVFFSTVNPAEVSPSPSVYTSCTTAGILFLSFPVCNTFTTEVPVMIPASVVTMTSDVQVVMSAPLVLTQPLSTLYTTICPTSTSSSSSSTSTSSSSRIESSAGPSSTSRGNPQPQATSRTTPSSFFVSTPSATLISTSTTITVDGSVVPSAVTFVSQPPGQTIYAGASNTPASSSHSRNAGMIGGIIGGLIALAFIIGTIALFCRKARYQQNRGEYEDEVQGRFGGGARMPIDLDDDAEDYNPYAAQTRQGVLSPYHDDVAPAGYDLQKSSSEDGPEMRSITSLPYLSHPSDRTERRKTLPPPPEQQYQTFENHKEAHARQQSLPLLSTSSHDHGTSLGSHAPPSPDAYSAFFPDGVPRPNSMHQHLKSVPNYPLPASTRSSFPIPAHRASLSGGALQQLQTERSAVNVDQLDPRVGHLRTESNSVTTALDYPQLKVTNRTRGDGDESIRLSMS